MSVLLLALTIATSPVRAELVEAPPFSVAVEQKKSGPSTSSLRQGSGQAGRTKVGSAIEAERAFAADAQTMGQWAAFRKWAAPDAVMFTPQPTNAQAWLKDRKELAKAVEWWPTASWVSCDGTLAVNTGGSRWPDRRVGYFTTVWRKQPNGEWRWVLDHGDDLSTPRPMVQVVATSRASCSRPLKQLPVDAPLPEGAKSGEIASDDATLRVQWHVTPSGARLVHARVAQDVKSAKLPPGAYLAPALTNLVVPRAP